MKVLIALPICIYVFLITDICSIADVPDWFTNPPANPRYLYATGTGTSRDLQLAIDIARLNARVEMLSQKQIAVSGQLEFLEAEAGAGTTIAVSKVSGILRGCVTIKQDVQEEDKLFRAYVLMEMPAEGVYTELIQKIDADKDLYEKFKETQWFKDMKMGKWPELDARSVEPAGKLATTWGQIRRVS